MTLRSIATLAIAVGLLALAVWLNWQSGKIERLQTRLDVAEKNLGAFQRATEADAETLQSHREIDAITKEATHEVRQLPGAETPVDPDRRASLCDGLAGVSDYTVCTD